MNFETAPVSQQGHVTLPRTQGVTWKVQTGSLQLIIIFLMEEDIKPILVFFSEYGHSCFTWRVKRFPAENAIINDRMDCA